MCSRASASDIPLFVVGVAFGACCDSGLSISCLVGVISSARASLIRPDGGPLELGADDGGVEENRPTPLLLPLPLPLPLRLTALALTRPPSGTTAGKEGSTLRERGDARGREPPTTGKDIPSAWVVLITQRVGSGS